MKINFLGVTCQAFADVISSAVDWRRHMTAFNGNLHWSNLDQHFALQACWGSTKFTRIYLRKLSIQKPREAVTALAAGSATRCENSPHRFRKHTTNDKRGKLSVCWGMSQLEAFVRGAATIKQFSAVTIPYSNFWTETAVKIAFSLLVYLDQKIEKF